MVKLPIYENTRALSDGLSTFKVFNSEGAERDITRGVNALESGLSAVADVMDKRRDRDERFTAERERLDLDNRLNTIQREEAENIPETGQGFHDRTMSRVQTEAQAFIDRMPESQRQAMELSVQRDLVARSDAMARVEVTQNRNFLSTVTQRHIGRLETNVREGHWDRNVANAEIDRFISGVGTTPENAAFFRTQMQRTVDSSRLEFLRQQNPAEFARQAQSYGTNGPSANASEIQRLIIEQSKLHGGDPRQALIVAHLESGNVADAPGAGTIRGLYQMTEATRRRLAPMLGTTPDALTRDPALQTAAFAILNNEIKDRLEANGIPVTAANLWGGHFLGQAGLMHFLKADPNADAYELYRSYDPRLVDRAFSTNGDLLRRGMTVGQVLAKINGRVDAASRAVDGAIERGPATSANGPVEIMGERFEGITAADLATPLAKAEDELRKANQERIRRAVTEQNADPNVSGNMYDAAWRKYQDDAAAASGAAGRVAAGDAAEIARWTQFADVHGYMPRAITASVLGMINGPDRNAQIVGYEMAARVLRNNGTDGLRLAGFGGDGDTVGNNNAAKIRDYVALTVHGGLDNAEAARRVTETHTDAFQQRSRDKDFAERQRDARARRTWGELEGYLKTKDSALHAWWNGTERDRGPMGAAARQRFEERYQSFFDYHFRAGANEDLAAAHARADVMKAFNQTSLFGAAGSMMPYPPERNYTPLRPLRQDANGRPVEVSSLSPAELQQAFGYIPEQAVGQARFALSADKTTDKWRDKITPKDVALVPTGVTATDVERRIAPSYELWARQPGTNNWARVQQEFRADVAQAREALNDEARAWGAHQTTVAPTGRRNDAAAVNRRDAFRQTRGQ